MFAHTCELMDKRDCEIANPCDASNDLFVLRELRDAIWEFRNKRLYDSGMPGKISPAFLFSFRRTVKYMRSVNLQTVHNPLMIMICCRSDTGK